MLGLIGCKSFFVIKTETPRKKADMSANSKLEFNEVLNSMLKFSLKTNVAPNRLRNKVLTSLYNIFFVMMEFAMRVKSGAKSIIEALWLDVIVLSAII